MKNIQFLTLFALAIFINTFPAHADSDVSTLTPAANPAEASTTSIPTDQVKQAAPENTPNKPQEKTVSTSLPTESGKTDSNPSQQEKPKSEAGNPIDNKTTQIVTQPSSAQTEPLTPPQAPKSTQENTAEISPVSEDKKTIPSANQVQPAAVNTKPEVPTSNQNQATHQEPPAQTSEKDQITNAVPAQQLEKTVINKDAGETPQAQKTETPSPTSKEKEPPQTEQNTAQSQIKAEPNTASQAISPVLEKKPEAPAKETESKKPLPFAAPEKLFNAKYYKLDNGLQVVVFENKRAPVVTHMVWYRVGSADEAEGKSGIAHFLEHLMFKGQKDLKPGQFSKIIRSLGGQDNAFTSYDYTAYYQSVAKEHLETVMIMESGRMRNLNIPPEEFTSENKVIQEERRQRTDNDPRVQMSEQINAALFPNHRYGVPVIGWMHEIQALTLDDAKSFYDRYYTPNNAILVVSGDVAGERVLELAKKTYGPFPSHNIPERVRAASPEFIAQNDITLTHDTIKEPVFMRSYRVPSFRQNPSESLALQVTEQILSGGSSSILYDSLVREKKLAIETSFSYDPNTWDDATFDFYAAHTLKISADKLEQAFDNELRALIKNGVSDTVLENAIRTLQADSIYALDSVEGPAMILGRTLITGMSIDDIEGWAKNIGLVTKEQVQSVAKKYLNPDALYKHPPINGYLKPPADR